MLGFPWMPRDRLRKFTCFCEDFTARGVLAETLPARTGLITWGPPSIREAGGARERVPWLSQKRPARPRSVVPAPLPCVFALFASLTFSFLHVRSEASLADRALGHAGPACARGLDRAGPVVPAGGLAPSCRVKQLTSHQTRAPGSTRVPSLSPLPCSPGLTSWSGIFSFFTGHHQASCFYSS